MYLARIPAGCGRAHRGRPRRADAGHRLYQRLLPRDRHPGRHLRRAGPRPQHRRRPRRAARPRLRGLLRRRRLLVGDRRLAARQPDLRRRLPAGAVAGSSSSSSSASRWPRGAGVLLGLPVLRLRGDYLAIVTLGFGEVIRVLANNLDKPINFTNGPKGITPIAAADLFAVPLSAWIDPTPSIPSLLPRAPDRGVAILVNRRLEDSHIGRAWEAIREDETGGAGHGRAAGAHASCWPSPAAPPSPASMGVVFSAKQVFINPESFTFLESIGVLAMVILGGMGSIPGAVLGATVVTVLNLQVLKGLSLWLNELKNAGVSVLRLQPGQPAHPARAGQVRAHGLRPHPRPHDDLPAAGHPSRRAGASASSPDEADVSALFEARGVTKRFGGLTAAQRGGLRARARHRLDHRPQRRRQDHALQRLHRPLRARRRRRSPSAGSRCSAADPTRSPRSASAAPSRTSASSPT